jgi:hypothetical protein
LGQSIITNFYRPVSRFFSKFQKKIAQFRYNLTAREDQFVKSVKQDFNQKNMLTEEQEEKLESLYK